MTVAYERFLASMRIGYGEWHDGVPYDLDALAEVTPAERAAIERKLVARRDKDWRDTQALARLGTPRAIKALRSSLAGPNREVRLAAAAALREKELPVDLDGIVIEGLRNARIGDGFIQATRLAARYPSPAIEQTLLQGAQWSTDRGIFFPAVLLYLHGQSASPEMGPDNQVFCQRFRVAPGAARDQAVHELCERIGGDPSQLASESDFPPRRRPGSSWRWRALAVLSALAALGIVALIAWQLAHR